MNRKILFRGKSLFKGDWWEGFYVYSKSDNKHYIVQDSGENGNLNQFVNFRHFAEVDPSTIGQFTGMSDKDGNKIFEGDIVSNEVVECLVKPSLVVWEPFGFRLERGDFYSPLPLAQAFATKILGKIHENPELLEEVK